ncbi:hypothetical protein CTEN210_04161 [Chaetoceros tenuissimus]|uniref:Uncharacterized protein n=1 Tax=Chaetoceros tenuissimus TaxID=426638 RepID=A0AAD3H2A6_9STRA|nr:hypothetical protein CTEN210_04161 [Chaetoceros tenuissimus]
MEKDILDPFGFPIHNDENQHTPQTFEWNKEEASPNLISQFSPRFTSAARMSKVEPKQLFQNENRLLNDITESDSQNSKRSRSQRFKEFYASRNLRGRDSKSTPVRQRNRDSMEQKVSVAWPGTLNDNDDTVQEESSHESAQQEVMANTWMQTSNSREEKQTSSSRGERRSSVRRRKIEQLRRRVAEFHDSFLEEEEDADVVDLDQDPTEYSNEKPSDRHLAAALSHATSVESTPDNSPARNILNISHDSAIPEHDTVEVYELDTTQLFSTPRKKKLGIDTSNSMTRIKSAGKLSPSLEERARRQNLTDKNGVARLCAAALKDRECTFQTVAHGANVKGYKGFINKTQDVPNLIDDLSVTSASTVATNTVTPKKYALHAKLDVEENEDEDISVSSMQAENSDASVESNSRLEKMQSQVDIVRLNASFSTVQTTSEDYARRQRSHDFDAGLTDSDTDYAATTRKGTAILNQEDDDDGYFSSSSSSSDSEDGGSDHNLSQYRVNEEQNKMLVKAYRNMSKFTSRGSYSGEDEGAKQSFALVEFRSRIMASDIERGFERMGGTTVVDDIVLTNHYQTKCRVRDAVIVSKAWREGTCPKDAITAKNLIGERDFYVKRSSRPISSNGSTSSTSLDSLDSTCSKVQIVYERIDWCDDTDLSLLACFGSKTLRGTDIFTEGDCQSMLLKLTHEHCEILREDLNEAIARKNSLEIAEDFLETLGEMSDAELEYFEVMVEVEALTSKLEKAERAFESVKHEIESLVKEYEDMLEDMDDSSSSDDEDCRSSRSESSDSSNGSYERERLARRAQRAELNAEIAAKEIENKEKELVELRQKLDNLEAQSAIMASDYEAKLKTHSLLSELTAKLKDASFDSTTQKSLIYAASTVGTDPDQDGAKARLKAKFRERRLSKITDEDNKESSGRKDSEKPSIKSTTNKQRLSGKLHQRLEFFERSLKSVNES